MVKIKTPFYLLKIIIAFLKDRKFRVKVGNFVTNLNNIKCGVPQGACLSPTLFSIYINDSPNRNDKNKENTVIFADDLGYFFFFRKITKAILAKINKYLSELGEWAKKWRLTLATHKCNYMILSRKNKIIKDCEVELLLNNQPLEMVNSTKFLGLRLDNRLNFNDQVEYIRTTCQERMNILKIVSHKSWHLDHNTRIQIYKSLVRSLLEYSAFIYDTLSNNMKDVLNAVQYNALRIIYDKDRRFGNKNLLKLANIETIKSRMNNLKLTYINSAIKNKNPIISEVVDEYKNFYHYGMNRHTLNTKTPLCNIITKVS